MTIEEELRERNTKLASVVNDAITLLLKFDREGWEEHCGGKFGDKYTPDNKIIELQQRANEDAMISKGFDGNKCPCCGVQLACTGCGTTKTIDEIRREHPRAISCCPEREMRPIGAKEKLEMIIATINGWDDGHQFKASYVNDGGGHFDFMGLTVTDAGKKELHDVLLNARPGMSGSQRR